MKTFFKWFSIVFASIWLIYAGVFAYVMNTRTFEKWTGMDNPELTHINFRGAYSFFPGHLHAAHALVFISDQNVSIKIEIQNLSARFALRPILDSKTIRIDDLRIQRIHLDLGSKTPAESFALIKKYASLNDVSLAFRLEKGLEARKNHVKLDFKHLVIEKIDRIKTSVGDFTGDLAIEGGFFLQPGADVEIYPTELIVKNGDLPGQFTHIAGKIQAQFDPFFVPETPGNAVFAKLNAKVELQAIVQSLAFLNLTLRKLPNYQVSQGETHVKLNLDVDHGQFGKGGGLNTDPSYITLETPDIRASGTGRISWKVLAGDKSELLANMNHITVKQIKDNSQQGELSNLDLKLNLYGNKMQDAFHGVTSDLQLRNIVWKLQSPVAKKQSKTNVNFKGRVEGNGRILGISGLVPRQDAAAWRAQSTHLDLKLVPFEMRSSFLPLTTVTGTLSAVAKPIDFGIHTLVIPEIKTKLNIAVKDHGSTDAEGLITNVNYTLAPYHQWKGHTHLSIDQTKPFVQALRDADKMGALLGNFAQVEHFTNDVDWELAEKYGWFRFNEISSRGPWKGFGSLLNNSDGLTGAFELRVAGIPVGLRITPEKTDVKLLPSKEWYNELIIEQPSQTAARSNP